MKKLLIASLLVIAFLGVAFGEAEASHCGGEHVGNPALAPDGYTIQKIWVKAGQGCFGFTESGTDGCYTANFNGARTKASVSLTGYPSPTCQQISHLEAKFKPLGVTPTATPITPTATEVPTETPTETPVPPTPTPTNEPSETPTPTENPEETWTPTPKPTNTPEVTETPAPTDSPTTTPTQTNEPSETPTNPPEKKKPTPTPPQELPKTGFFDEGFGLMQFAVLGIVLAFLAFAANFGRRKLNG